MSSNTHLTALSLLQIDFRENRNKSIARRLRVGGMILLGLFLLVALVPTTAYNWLLIITQSQQRTGNAVGRSHSSEPSAAGIPARCFWQSRCTGGRTADSAWPFIILVSSYAWRGLLLFQRSHKAVKDSCRRKVLQPLQRSLDHLLMLAKRTRRHENHGWLGMARPALQARLLFVPGSLGCVRIGTIFRRVFMDLWRRSCMGIFPDSGTEATASSPGIRG